ncbi:MAG: cellulase family glycosylhydrolase [Anaerolineales bacterium]
MKSVKRSSVLFILVLLVMGLAQPPRPTRAAVGFHISGRNLLDANGNNFVMRGIAHAHTWYPTQTSSFANIKAKGANTVRVVLSGGRWTANGASDVANVISLCKTNKLICVLEDHDTTGYGEDGAAYSLAQAVSYWQSIQSVLTGQEAYVIINLGNEPYGNNNAANWVNDTKNAIAAMRSAGFQHTLMVDAPNWGQDWQFVMRDNAASIFASDPARNTIFSIHMYGVFDTAAEIQSYVSTFVNAGLPLDIGEFGNMHSDGDPDEDTIMSQAQSNGIGYIGWSWSGNGGGVEYLDMVTNFDPNQVTAWGTRIISGANGIQQTSREASVYGGGGATNTPTRTPTRSRTPTRTTTGPTPTRTRTPTVATVTRTPTSGGGGTACSPVNATITAPFTYNGVGTFCWRSNNLGSYINSWNLATLTVNGVDFTNKFAFTTGPNTPTLPAKMSDGYWYIYYVGNYAWSHFEAK